ncbi:protein translocase subunit SecD [Capillibacterium thermochitinicola]|uniref:Protein translocase subunit SecD n=1 Tax=Capillibacterium thermochitinicola TaxID=2699427 RepID=A0A8J6I123_9FIRM|nr:protein translocase subunit SecD [Capillibacterium thermochitinicola]
MRRDLRRKTWFILILVVAVGVYAILPIFSPTLKQLFFRGNDPIRRGLDLKGGMEIILAPDYRVEERVLAEVEKYAKKAVAGLGVGEPAVSLLGMANDNNRYEGLALKFASAAEAQKVLAAGVIKTNLTWRSGIEEKKLKLNVGVDQADPTVIRVAVQEDPANFPADALYQAKVIIENRINSSGLSETVVRLDQTKGRIEVQLPGIRSQEEAERLIKSTGRLNFRLDGKIVMYGSDLEEAQAGFSQETGAPVINLRFGKEGARLFEKITSEHVNEVLAIYLDEEMLMAPIISEPIPNGQAQISMGRGVTFQEAKDYAILMKSGALPLSLRSVMTTQVAPTLGTETVKLSLIAGVFGIILVFIMMIAFYGRMGVVADLALVIYAILVLGAIAIFRGVLTLPGIAGLILGIGMAVDANVIIFERIKDEVRLGRGIHSALEAGFDRAYVTILDSNITTLIAAVVLYAFGSGAVKGFAVTLSISILASMFTALFVSKTFLSIWVEKAPERFLAKYVVRG